MAEEQWVPENKDELMSAIRREWKSLMEVVAKLEAANKLTTSDEGGWSAKDNLAHLSEWMRSMMNVHMARLSEDKLSEISKLLNITPEVAQRWDVEEMNSIFFERNRNRSTGEVLDELDQVYAELVKKLEAAPFEELLKPRHADDPEKRPLLLWILGDTSEHFAEHRETIEKML